MEINEIHKTEATHYIMDFYDNKNYYILDDAKICLDMLTKALELAKCGILNIYTHKFTPQGLSINATLSESHCAIHTWPEKNYCAIDLYGCGSAVNLKAGVDFFLKALQPKKTKIIKLRRGYKEDASNFS